MKKKTPFLLICPALAIELCLVADIMLMFCSVYMSMKKFTLLCMGIFIICAILTAYAPHAAKGFLLGLSLFLFAAAISFPLFRRYAQSEQFLQSTVYREVDSEKDALFSGKMFC